MFIYVQILLRKRCNEKEIVLLLISFFDTLLSILEVLYLQLPFQLC